MLRLTEKEAQQLGTRVKDAKPRKARVPHPEFGRGLNTQLRAMKLPEGTPEFRFHPTRKWRYDLAWPERRLVVDIDGGAWLHKHGRTAHSHGQGAGFERDRAKDAEAALLGYRVLRFTVNQVKRGKAFAVLEQLLAARVFEARSYSPGGTAFRVSGGPLRGETTMGWHIVDAKGFTVGVSCDYDFLKAVGVVVYL